MITLLSELTSAEGLTALADPHPISLTAPRAASTIHHESANFYHELLCTLHHQHHNSFEHKDGKGKKV
jgi:hypothetical protein